MIKKDWPTLQATWLSMLKKKKERYHFFGAMLYHFCCTVSSTIPWDQISPVSHSFLPRDHVFEFKSWWMLPDFKCVAFDCGYFLFSCLVDFIPKPCFAKAVWVDRFRSFSIEILVGPTISIPLFFTPLEYPILSLQGKKNQIMQNTLGPSNWWWSWTPEHHSRILNRQADQWFGPNSSFDVLILLVLNWFWCWTGG